ncbi:hypothetical protein [Gimesia fumaroli]|uniref:Uncharacterized protein n=1 Tax=Gimesia fumaroli TaxID=2527976 RepID=A0A518I9V6_9PLAN|nr:hypothetical protein [Gimesia fumaroli]QDV49905.1 hypothetical protein Enr17x_19260 [Gimesia fumaroli]
MKRSVQKKKKATQRRPTRGSALPKRRAEKPRSAMKAMQQRLGNRATQSLIGSSGAASKKEGRQDAKKEPEPETENQTANRSRVADTQAALPTTAIENPVVASTPISAQTVSTKSTESFFVKFLHSSATQIADQMGSIGDRLGMDFQSDRREYLQEAPTLTAYLPQDDVTVQARENAGPAEFSEMPGAEEVVLPPPEKAESMTDAETTVPAQPEGDNVGIDPGTKPQFRADGEADTSRMGHVTNAANQTANQAAQQVAEEIEANTSASRIIPVSVDRQERIEIAESGTTQPTEQSAEMLEYFDTDVGNDVRAIADADFAPLLNAVLAEPRNQVEAAAEQRDAERNQAFADAQAEADVATDQARADQQQAIAEGQAEVQAEKEKGVAEQQEQLAQFNTEVAHRYQSHQAEVAGKITEEQERANRTIDKAKEEAEQERKNAEEKAEHEKREREKNRPKEKKNLLGRIVSSVKRAVSRWKDALVKAVKKVFSEAKKVVTRVLDTAKKVAVGIINRLRDVVVGMIQTFASGLKILVVALLIAFPKLRAKVNAAIDVVVENAVEVVNAIAKRLEDTVVVLIDRVQSVVTKIMDLFELVIVTQIQIVGAILNGEFLDAAKILFLAACKAVGIPGEEFLSILSDARDAFMDIIKQPARFLKSLIHSVGQGMSRFMSNFRQHFVGGITGWIFGAFAAGGITLPKTFTLKSVFSMLLEIFGFTYQYIRGKVVEMVGERNVAVVEDVMAKVKSLFTEGPGIIWEWIKDKMAEVKQKIVDAVSEWLITQLIMKAANKLASMFTPVGAFVQAVLMMYNTMMFFIERIKEIFVWVKSITSSFTRMAKGMVGAAAEWIEQAMANSIPLIIAFLARLVGLGDIGDKIKSVVSKLRQPIDKVIEFVVEKLVAFGKKVWGGIKSGAQQVANWWDAKEEFKDEEGKQHHLYFELDEDGKSARLMVASDPMDFEEYLKQLRDSGRTDEHNELEPCYAPIREAKATIKQGNKNEKRLDTVPTHVNRLAKKMDKSRQPSHKEDPVLEWVHLVLDGAGLIPVLGVFPDAINAGIYLIEGDWEGVGFSAAGMIPIFGHGATVTKHGIKVTKEALEKVGKEGVETGIRYAKRMATNSVKHRFTLKEYDELIAFWETQIQEQLNPKKRQEYRKYIETLRDLQKGKPTKPHFRQTEMEMQYLYGQIGSSPNQPFTKTGSIARKKDGSLSRRPPKGSTVPDIHGSELMVEVKSDRLIHSNGNIDVNAILKMLQGGTRKRSLRKQIAQRVQITGHGRLQTVLLDLRGQSPTDAQIEKITKIVADDLSQYLTSELGNQIRFPIEHVQVVF